MKLKNRSFIQVEGADSFSFLQSIVTNDMEILRKEPAIYALMLTPQGKYLYDFFIYNFNNSLLIDCNSVFIDEFFAKLQIYKMRSDVKLMKIDGLEVFLCQDVENADFLFCAKDPRLSELGFRCLAEKNLSKIEHSQEQYENLKMEHAIPEGHVDMMQGKSFPLEFGIDFLNGFSFSKGCYVGQEVVARSKFRGVIRKKTYVASFEETPKFTENHPEVMMNGEKIGFLSSQFEKHALLLIRDADLEKDFTKNNIFIENHQAKLTLPKWYLS